MKKMFFVAIIVILFMLTFVPMHGYALGNNSLATKTPTVTSTGDLNDWSDEFNKDQSCNSILGDPGDENSVAWLIDKILTYTTIVGMVLVVVLSSIDFLKVIAKSDDEAMAKAGKKLALRLVFAGLLFFVPTLTRVIFDIFGLTADCGIRQQ